MGNPLKKRLLRELKGEFGKYLVIFILLVFSISLVSGFLVADRSMIIAYDNSFEKYNIEDGHFLLQHRMNRSQKEDVEAYGVSVYDLSYVEEDLDNGSVMRIFPDREQVNKVCVMSGELPDAPDEIAIDRMYADNNRLSAGDTIRYADTVLTISGLVALSDYSALFADNNDSMFDAMEFGVGVVTAEKFADFPKEELNYCYAWTYDDPPAGEEQEKAASDDFLEYLQEQVHLEQYIPRYLNQAICFTGEDLGQDREMMLTLLYIIIVIIAFVYIILTNDTLTREANVIGTLRASGYTKRELIRHYMAVPLLVTLVSALVGNILGYTVLKYVCADMYYGSYSLPTYETVWNAEAFLLTTIVPMIIIIVLIWLILRIKLSLPPLRFLRRDIGGRGRKRTLLLPKQLPFFSRFAIRVILQNAASYAILFIGILFANILLMFGMCFPSVLDHYQKTLKDSMFSNYQYMLTIPEGTMDDSSRLKSLFAMMEFSDAVDTENEAAEKFSAYSLQMPKGNGKSEEILLYGIQEGSAYIPVDVSGGQVYITSAYAAKYHLEPGDQVTLKDPYEPESYAFTITGIYPYDAGLDMIMSREKLNAMMDLEEESFAGYFSDEPLTDIDEKYVGTIVDYKALTKISRQLDLSMGQMMILVDFFSVVIFLVLIYLLSKLIIEKNAQSISMTKILGYKNGEISRLYILPTTAVVIICLIVTLPICTRIMQLLFAMIMKRMTGWIPWHMDPVIYGKMFVIGMLAYLAIALLEIRRIRRVPMDAALKNVE